MRKPGRPKTQNPVSATATYKSWVSMKQRCLNQNARRYAHYGGRGILVCDQWLTFVNFLADMGHRPDGMSLERKDNNGNYTPDNCCWATQSTQMRNQRVTRRVQIEGKTYVAADLADQSGLKTDTVIERAKVGLSLREVLSPERRVFAEGLALGGIANGARQQAKTHCNHGHPYTEANTMVSPQGWRRCRACHNAKQRRLNAARRL